MLKICFLCTTKTRKHIKGEHKDGPDLAEEMNSLVLFLLFAGGIIFYFNVNATPKEI